eukprot:scaffold44389_cov45-Phaeocystis_antarctica.AAC.1
MSTLDHSRLEANSALRLCSKSATSDGSSSCSPEPMTSSSATCCCCRTGRAAIIEALYTVRTCAGTRLPRSLVFAERISLASMLSLKKTTFSKYSQGKEEAHLELGRLPRGEPLLEPLREGLPIDKGLQPLGTRGREARHPAAHVEKVNGRRLLDLARRHDHDVLILGHQ